MDVISFPFQFENELDRYWKLLAVLWAIPTNPIHFALSFRLRLQTKDYNLNRDCSLIQIKIIFLNSNLGFVAVYFHMPNLHNILT